MDMEALDYMYAAVLYEDIWEDVAGYSPEPTEHEPTEQVPPADDIHLMPYFGRNWQEMPDEGGYTISATEPTLLGT
ncbi:MAG: hypothetical protein ACKPKO_60595, partial [Candidatus Fonsibacter sp.]